ncbi:RNA polymerase subunit sigma [Actinacidiphila acidipaludis]|uniref:RNA polymerase subunit sigma n=1 Tax=Actinacidiphila acidipaludis TaxID=2873382 RepID=A0ABS7PYZ6_9ACTN|nr:RNA polymerase subunit sigma [Streptomyces acidipaludis]MBY8876088.1 RNA polymerase subunit sigma [Streptomyces acidipaludis]
MNRTDALGLAELLDERRHLLDVACWMLGSSSESESVLDETYREWYDLSDVDRREIGAPRSWLARVVGRICLGRLAPSGRAEDAAPPAEDAGVTGTAAPGSCVPVEQQVSQVLLSALDSFSPAERAAFLVTGSSRMPAAPWAPASPGEEAVARTRAEWGELGDRIGRRLQAQRQRAGDAEHDAVVRAVRLACVTQDPQLLVSVLAADAAAFFDGGGKVRALVRPVEGGEQVAYSLLALVGPRGRTSLAAQSVNGRTGLVARYDHMVAAVFSLEVITRRVTRIWVTLNPDKLRAWNRSSRRP